ncbi:hypothetical protein AJ79_10043 [Helicocarpus griseus UAMH5409]|uniref:HRDC domain-containing protein n=1 Tax=Helicocarpus griseus UAMH5409 TaxID=1447875 RepID=A0A2B7W7G3_9EURO|nr:hypothetical protein AJ79_10043 [Helicocarpus griseus UAMH5409]
MDIATDFAPFEEQVKAALINSTKSAGLVSSEDLNFHRSFSKDIAESVDEQSARLLNLTNSILKIATSGSDLEVPELHNEDEVEENWRGVVDVIDQLLEKADACLDEFTGIIKKLSPSQEERAALLSKGGATTHFPKAYDFGSSKVSKPQLLFNSPPNNQDTSPFKPLLRSKPHAITPLSASVGEADPNGNVYYKHPYETEIRNCTYPLSAYSISAPVEPKPFDTTKATFVDTLEGVHSMLAELKKATEIAIDLEHHDAHSYHGIVCLMQISTRNKDWVVDTLRPWREELQVLNEVFADPKILKVLHGSTMDIIWLQRDLGLYIVGLFDTFHAADALNYPKKNLKYLLEKFVNFEAQKKYQMADWRLRPLLPGMFDYARSDTHFLLYIYDCMRNELLENSTPDGNLVDYVLEKSKQEALQRYERPVYDAETGQGSGGWADMLVRSSNLFSKEQFAVFRAVHQWRDEVARSEDEGAQYVLSKSSLFKVAHAMPLEPASLFRTVSPVSTFVSARVLELIQVIKEAKIAGATGPELRDVLFPYKQTTDESKPATPVPPPQAETETRLVPAARAEVSQFWGSTLEQQPHPPVPVSDALAATAEAFLLSLPVPFMSAKVTERPIKEEPAASQPTAPEPTAAKPPPTNEVFTIKQFGAPKKRKISPSTDEVAGSDPSAETTTTTTVTAAKEVAADDTGSGSNTTNSENTENKAKRRCKDKKEKGASSGLQASSNKGDSADFEPFDYGNAESVLHANPVENNNKDKGYRGGQKQKQKRQFNPYAKAMDAPQGMRKAKKEIEGKSFTFR